MKSVNIIKLFLVTLLIIVFSNPTIIQAEENQSVVTGIELNYDYIPKNGSNAHELTWGSDIGISAKILYSDETAASDDDSKVIWTVSSVLNNNIQVATKEYVNAEGYASLEIYAPFGYCDELVVTACLATNNDIEATYQLSIIDGTKWNGASFFEFLANAPEGADVLGEEPEVKETWNAKEKKYSIVIPENLYQVKGYTFQYWKDEFGKKYKPRETLTVSPEVASCYSLKAVWKMEKTQKVEKNPETPETTESATSEKRDEKKDTVAPKTGDKNEETRIWYVAAVMSIIGIFICYKGRKKTN